MQLKLVRPNIFVTFCIITIHVDVDKIARVIHVLVESYLERGLSRPEEFNTNARFHRQLVVLGRDLFWRLVDEELATAAEE